MSAERGLERLQQFLRRYRWEVSATKGPFSLYSPSPDLGMDPDFRLAVPARTDLPDLSRALESTVSLLAEIYHQSADTLLAALVDCATVLSIRVSDQDVDDGSIPFDKFDALVHRMKAVVLNAANSVVEDDPLTVHVSAIAEEYLRHCSFMQTQKGSFVARVQMPASLLRGQTTLFGVDSLEGEKVTERVRGALAFLNNAVIAPHEVDFDDSAIDSQIERHREVVNVRLLRNYAKLFEETRLSKWTFSFVAESGITTIEPEPITSATVQQVNAYVDRIATRLKHSAMVETSGLVVQLQSKNPSRDKNFVRMEVFFGHRLINLLVQVNRTDYTKAIKAHMSGKIVTVKGHARKMQTQHRIDYPEIFEIQD
jgi:hypothetical protein